MTTRSAKDAQAPNPAVSVTALLRAWRGGDEEAWGQLVPLVYDELRRVARRQLRRERGEHTLQPTALVHEAFLRLVDQKVTWQNRAHFFGVAAQLMRRILVDHARQRHAAKRGGGAALVALDSANALAPEREVDLLALDGVLEQLTSLDPQQGRIVELRFFGGLTVEETAEALGISPATVKRDWSLAKAWLYRALVLGEH
jgi:RNA polymerase sigma factor (TIGR02999 family)